LQQNKNIFIIIKMFWSFWESSTVEETKETSSVSIFTIFGIAAVIFSLGYLLRPVSEIVDELHDSHDDDKD